MLQLSSNNFPNVLLRQLIHQNLSLRLFCVVKLTLKHLRPMSTCVMR